MGARARHMAGAVAIMQQPCALAHALLQTHLSCRRVPLSDHPIIHPDDCLSSQRARCPSCPISCLMPALLARCVCHFHSSDDPCVRRIVGSRAWRHVPGRHARHASRRRSARSQPARSPPRAPPRRTFSGRRSAAGRVLEYDVRFSQVPTHWQQAWQQQCGAAERQRRPWRRSRRFCGAAGNGRRGAKRLDPSSGCRAGCRWA